MFHITQDPYSRSDNLYLNEITYNGSIVLIMCVVGIWRHAAKPRPRNDIYIYIYFPFSGERLRYAPINTCPMGRAILGISSETF